MDPFLLGPYVTDTVLPSPEIPGFRNVGKSLEYTFGGDICRHPLFEKRWPGQRSKRFHHFNLFVLFDGVSQWPGAPCHEVPDAAPAVDDLVEIGAFLLSFFRINRPPFGLDDMFTELVAEIPGLIDDKVQWPVSHDIAARLYERDHLTPEAL